MHMKRKLHHIVVESSPVKEVEVGADSVVYSAVFYASETPAVALVLAMPDGATPVKRMVWQVKTGDEVPGGAQAGDHLGTIVVGGALISVFIEKQDIAITRASHRSRF